MFLSGLWKGGPLFSWHMIFRLSVALFLVAAWSPVSRAFAEDPRIKSLSVSVWPEYDDPRVLVQYEGDFEGLSLPQEVSFLVPQGAAIGSACGVSPNGQHTSETWKSKDVEGGFTQITYKLTQPKFHVEYYYQPLAGSPNKSMAYSYKTLYPVDTLNLEVQQPLKAAEFAVTPATSEVSNDKDGFKYYHYRFDKVPTGGTSSFQVSYTKPDDNPSVKRSQTTGQASQAGDSNTTAILVIVVGAVVLGGGAFYAVSRKPQRRYGTGRGGLYPSVAAASRGSSAPVNPRRGKGASASRAAFCRQCGTAIQGADNFCPKCGQRVR